MAETQVQDRVVNSDGQTYRGVTSTTETTSDPYTGVATRRSSTREWSGLPLGGRIIGLAAGIVFVLLGFDFVFHAVGAANVGFAAFIFTVGRALAAPFAGIFTTTYAATGSLIVWADVLAVAVYAIAAVVVAKVLSMIADQRAKGAV